MAGTRVVRGPNWKYRNQDASEGHVGTVIDYKRLQEIGKLGRLSTLISDNRAALGFVVVTWDCGIRGMYRIGHEGAFDLRVSQSLLKISYILYNSQIRLLKEIIYFDIIKSSKRL